MKKFVIGLVSLLATASAYAATPVTPVDGSGGILGSIGTPLYVTGGGDGGMGPVTIANGADVTQGNTADAVYSGSGDASNNSILKGIYARAASTDPAAVNSNIGTSAPIRIVSAAASTNLTQISDSACTVMRVSGYNARASAVYIRFYNIADQSVTVGTSATYISKLIPATTGFDLPVEQTFSTACSFAMTTGSADNDTGALTAADILHLAVTYR